MRGLKRVACYFYEEEAKRLDGTIFHRVYHMVLRRPLKARCGGSRGVYNSLTDAACPFALEGLGCQPT